MTNLTSNFVALSETEEIARWYDEDRFALVQLTWNPKAQMSKVEAYILDTKVTEQVTFINAPEYDFHQLGSSLYDILILGVS